MLRRSLVLGGLAAGMLCPRISKAAAYPDRPVRLIVPNDVGGNPDLIARLIQPVMSRVLGQPFVVENRPGSGGVIGTEVAARSRADGYTLLMGSNGAIIYNPILMRQLPYAVADFKPVGLIMRAPNVINVSKAFPAQNLADFIAYARARPGRVTAGSSGVGTSNHMLLEMFNFATGANLLHVPYRGGGSAFSDLVNGRLDCYFDQVTTAIAQHRNDQTRIIAIADDRRLPQLPDIPTIAEAGFPDVVLAGFVGLMAPTGTPDEAIVSVAAALRAALADAEVIQRIEQTGGRVASAEEAAPAGFQAMLTREATVARQVVDRAQIRLD